MIAGLAPDLSGGQWLTFAAALVIAMLLMRRAGSTAQSRQARAEAEEAKAGSWRLRKGMRYEKWHAEHTARMEKIHLRRMRRRGFLALLPKSPEEEEAAKAETERQKKHKERILRRTLEKSKGLQR